MPSLAQFIGRRRARWAQLEHLLERSEGNRLRGLSAVELDALGGGYRQVVSDLAIARRDFPHDELTGSLNALAARAHLRLYRGPAGSWKALWRFFWPGFAQRFRSAGGAMAVAAALFFTPALWAYVAVQVSAEWREALVPGQLIDIMESGETWTDMEPLVRPIMAAAIFTNNLQVSFAAFAGGVIFGLGTVYVLIANGLSIGAILGAAQFFGVGALLWDFVGAHGYVEITCILIASAAGLLMGWAQIRPGLERRRDAMARASRRAVALVLGASPVFVAAGLIEGFVSPSGLSLLAKHAIGVGAGIGLWAFLLLAGRERRRRRGAGGAG